MLLYQLIDVGIGEKGVTFDYGPGAAAWRNWERLKTWKTLDIWKLAVEECA
jgi:hypothetical protein